MNRRLARSPTIADLREQARRVLPRMVFDMLEGGAGGEETLQENRDALRRVRLVPRAPVDVSGRRTGSTLFGRPAAFPLVIGPTGLASAFWPEGEIALARAAARAGIPFVMSSGAGISPEDLARAADGRRWFQLYMPPDREVAADWLRRVAATGFEALEVTVDGAVPGARARDARNGFSMPLWWTPGRRCRSRHDPAGHGASAAAALRWPRRAIRPTVRRRGGSTPAGSRSATAGRTDVLKGLALGASAVQVGRATLYGLAVAGEEGVFHALDLLRNEIDNAMALMGLTRPRRDVRVG